MVQSFYRPADVCDPGKEINFFSSGAYTRPSFSSGWSTLTQPDTEGLTAVYTAVLEKYNIPIDFTTAPPDCGTLPGIDIKRMNAIDAIRLSLAECLLKGQWWEIYEDNEGGVYFQNVFDNGSPGKIINLDVRLCVPSASKTNQVDMVVVRGYDAPPFIFAKDFDEFPDVVPPISGPVNPDSLSGSEPVFTVDMAELVGGCHATVLAREAVKSFIDPLIDDSVYGTQVQNPFYDISSFEEILKWAIKISGLPDDPESAAQYQYQWEETTTWYFNPGFPEFTRQTKFEDNPNFDCTTGLQGGNEDIVYYTGSFTYNGILFTDKYGYNWPLVIKPTKILYTGYKVNNIVQFGSGPTASNYIFVNPIPEFNILSEGSQWTYTIPDVNQFKINIYYQPEVHPDFWDFVVDFLEGGEGNTQLRVSNGEDLVVARSNQFVSPNFNYRVGILPAPGSLGYYVNGFWMGLELDRPCVRLTSVGDTVGTARELLDNMRVQYAPIIQRDPPPPVAYKHKDRGLVIITEEDQAQDRPDIDPTTCQNFDKTPMQEMQELMEGNVLDITLPFCENENVCGTVAETIFDYQTYTDIKTLTLTCGPDDEPELGAAVDGFDTNLRIGNIDYSYSDGSAYTIEVTLEPVFATVGSWNNGNWIKQTETVSRPAFIIWTAGDGINYRVMVQGLGVFNAFNTVRDNAVWRVGERVTVEIRNIPIEE